ncbi:MAG: hypothetical protein KAR38_15095, partial [Calditrichia bacterium]|nr:hypothetical protein [Calditrichia bacterium]
FMEYPIPMVNEPGKYIIHLTHLSDFSAITSGSVSLNFADNNGKIFKVESDQILREGIFTPEVEFKTEGKYNFTLTYKNGNINKTFNIGKINVYRSHNDIVHDEEEGEKGISFLKEQQWKTEFETEQVKYGSIKIFIHNYSRSYSPSKHVCRNSRTGRRDNECSAQPGIGYSWKYSKKRAIFSL